MDSSATGKPPKDLAEELHAKLRLEEQIRNAAEDMLQDIELNSRRRQDMTHKRRVQAQVDTASVRISEIRRQLRAMGWTPEEYADGSPSTMFASVSTEADESPLNVATSENGQPLEVSLENASRQFSRLFDSVDSSMSVPSLNRVVDRLIDLFVSFPMLRQEVALDQAGEKLKGLLCSTSSPMVVAGYRLVRLLTGDQKENLLALRLGHLDWVCVQSLARQDIPEYETERLQALLVARIGLNGPSIANAIAAIAEQPKDSLKQVCVETFAELAILDPEGIFVNGTYKLLLLAAVNSSPAVGKAISLICTRVVDRPESRKMLHYGQDFQSLLSVFTEESSIERLQCGVNIMLTMLRHWAGQWVFDLRLLIASLLVPHRNAQEAVLKLITQLISGSDSCYSRHFRVLILAKLLKLGLIDVLFGLEKLNSSVSVLVRNLLSQIYMLASQLLPPSLVPDAIRLPQPIVDEMSSCPPHSLPTAGIPVLAVESTLRRPISYSRQTAGTTQNTTSARLGQQIDDASFKQLVLSTHVLATKLYRQWNWDAVVELIQGPLRNPRRLDEAIRTSKFMKRLLSFYRPFKYRFANLHISRENRRFIEVFKELIRTLLDTPEGAKYLGGNKMLRQVAECLAQLDPSSGITSSEPLFSSRRLRTTLSAAYFEMLGVFTESQVGQQILADLRIFNMLYRICDVGRDDVVRACLRNFDYHLPGHPRILLTRVMAGHAAEKRTRRFATELIWEKMNSTSKDSQLWAVDILVGQLYDPEMSVAQAAVFALQKFCRDDTNLDRIIALRPTLAHLGNVGAVLNVLFLTRPAGFELMQGTDYVDREMDHWFHGFNDAYVSQIEEYLEENLMNDNQNLQPPRHFLGELVLTEQGAKLLQQRGDVPALAKFVSENLETTDPKSVTKLKGSLWALGHVASRSLGAALLDMNVVHEMILCFERSPIYTIRGTAFYALGLTAQSFEGAELLRQSGWGVSEDVYGRPLGIVLPPCLLPGSKFSMDEGHPEEKENKETREDSVEFPPRQDPSTQELLREVARLSNSVMAHDASNKLVALRASHPQLFTSPEVFGEVIRLLSVGHYKIMARRFLFELFDGPLLLERMYRRRSRGPRRSTTTIDVSEAHVN